MRVLPLIFSFTAVLILTGCRKEQPIEPETRSGESGDGFHPGNPAGMALLRRDSPGYGSASGIQGTGLHRRSPPGAGRRWASARHTSG